MVYNPNAGEGADLITSWYQQTRDSVKGGVSEIRRKIVEADT